MRISDWSSDVCSSDLDDDEVISAAGALDRLTETILAARHVDQLQLRPGEVHAGGNDIHPRHQRRCHSLADRKAVQQHLIDAVRSEEHTSELQSLMRISYAVFCLKKKTRQITTITLHSKYTKY